MTEKGGNGDMERAAQEEAYRTAVSQAATFEDLYATLREITKIPGGHREYTAEEIIKKIDDLRAGRFMLDGITRTYGIREAVQRLSAAPS